MLLTFSHEWLSWINSYRVDSGPVFECESERCTTVPHRTQLYSIIFNYMQLSMIMWVIDIPHASAYRYSFVFLFSLLPYVTLFISFYYANLCKFMQIRLRFCNESFRWEPVSIDRFSGRPWLVLNKSMNNFIWMKSTLIHLNTKN